VWTGPFVTTTRPSAHAFRMHARHAARNFSTGAGCVARKLGMESVKRQTRCAPLPLVGRGWG
jgi:hypothetical protein